MWLDKLLVVQFTGTKNATGGQIRPNPLLLFMWNMETPFLCQKWQVNRKEGRWRAGIGGQKKRTPCCNGMDRN